MQERPTLRTLREAAGMKQVEVAGLLGISKSRYWMMENGQRPVSLRHAMRVAAIYGRRVEDINFFAPVVPETRTTARDEQAAAAEA